MHYSEVEQLLVSYKWDYNQPFVLEFRGKVNSVQLLNFSKMRSCHFFLVQDSWVCHNFQPLIEGFHFTIDG